MRYIQWNKDAGSAACRGEYAQLMEQLKRQENKHQQRDKWTHVIFWTVAAAVWAVGIWLVILMVKIEYTSVWTSLLVLLSTFALSGITLVAGPVLGILAANVRRKSVHRQDLQVTRHMKGQGCQAIREFYGFCKPFLVTKCFESTDRKFRRHDVCLFFADGMLCLSANLYYPLFNPERDLGCYIFEEGEYSLMQVGRGSGVATELRAGETVFLLGGRTKEWIERKGI